MKKMKSKRHAAVDIYNDVCILQQSTRAREEGTDPAEVQTPHPNWAVEGFKCLLIQQVGKKGSN